MSGYWTGKKRPDISDRIANSNRLRVVSDETRLKMSIKRTGDKNPAYKGGLPNCKECTKKLSRYDASFCTGCKFLGERNPRFRSDISLKEKENNFKRMNFKKKIQPLVLARDNYTCVVCSDSPKYLHVDHIKSWKDYPELRLDLDNCRTVCRPCHYYITFKRKMPVNSNWGLTKAMTRKAG